MMIKLDATDVSIIQELNHDGRATATEIANKLGNISERVVQYRIKKLIRDEVIRVVAIIELEPLGFLTRADILIDVEPGKIKSVSRQLAKHDAISYVASHFGAHDISVTVHARDNKDFLAFLNESITSVSGVLNVQPILLPQLLKYPYLWFGFDVGVSISPMPFTAHTSSQSIKLEAAEIEIINLLIDDGRISFAQIARLLKNCSTDFVRSRVEFLIQNKIIQIKAVVNPEKIGYLIRADVFVKSEMSQTMDVAQKLAQLSITSRVAFGMGGDISVQLHGRSNDEIYDFITNTIPRIRGVKKTHTNIVAELVKEFHLCHLPKSIVL
jgi:DNA-binding Lrp family transcriptional regulator